MNNNNYTDHTVGGTQTLFIPPKIQGLETMPNLMELLNKTA